MAPEGRTKRTPPRSPGGKKGSTRMLVRRDGAYDGTFFGSLKWPETLVGAREIARFLRVAEKTAGKWLGQGRLPAGKDSRGRWTTTRRLLEMWIMKGGMANDRRSRIQRGDQVEKESLRELEKEGPLDPTSSHPVPPLHLRVAPSPAPETMGPRGVGGTGHDQAGGLGSWLT